MELQCLLSPDDASAPNLLATVDSSFLFAYAIGMFMR